MKKLEQAALDALDLKILRADQENNLVPQWVIAEAVGLSPPAVARRLQSLRESGVIAKDIAVVDGHAVGRPLTIIAHVTTENERLDLLDAMKERFARCPQIQQCYYVTGEMDFILILNVTDMAEYNELTRELFFDGGNVKSFQTCVSMQNVKTYGAIPL
ncbi:Lrp/AsnC family transcriptional regulator [Aureimonas sp. OT7]|uniref:Lrp/AsnC family transcriptional regulator n=1 Tax=Aureimonas sp. OT7 TaxID=2816454 RepID=UPI00178470B4|nr:Lrp/AsnC family transcriptional regulator [Aureimonas sp. OT7]QOG05685.1 Lrp/AsnC family transcriptional regulator [Aureimonas sp. OT7]